MQSDNHIQLVLTSGSDVIVRKKKYIWYTFVYMEMLCPFWISVCLIVCKMGMMQSSPLACYGIIIFYVSTLKTGIANCYSTIPGKLLAKVDYWASLQSWSTVSPRDCWKYIRVYHDRLVYVSENTRLLRHKWNEGNYLRSDEYPSFILSILFLCL